MKRYERYKDSGVQWMGEIPEHWELVLNGVLFHEEIRTPNMADKPLSLSQKDGVIPADELDVQTLKTSTYNNWKKVLREDLILNRFKAHLGVLFSSNYEGMVSFHYGVYKMRLALCPKYYEHLFHTEKYKYILAASSKGMTIGLQNLSNRDFYAIKSIVPPLYEQRAIVDYLKDKTHKIDQYVTERERERLLESLKQSEIANVVTKGLNPNAHMKDSGIPWIGLIPERWEVKRAKYMFNKEKREVRDCDEVITCFRDGQVTLRKNRRTTGFTESFTEIGYQGVRKGDLVIHQMDAFAGSIGVSDSDGKGTSVYHCCTPKGDYDVHYYAFLIRRMAGSGFIQSLYRGIRERSSDFKFPVFGNQYLIVPPLSEQQAIVAYLDEKLSKIDRCLADLQAEIDYLKEFKQRLISDAVTGQIKVTDTKEWKDEQEG